MESSFYFPNIQIEESKRKASIHRNNHISEIDSQFEGSNYPSEATKSRRGVKNHRESLPYEKQIVPNHLRQAAASVQSETMAYSEMHSPRAGDYSVQGSELPKRRVEQEMAHKIQALQEQMTKEKESALKNTLDQVENLVK